MKISDKIHLYKSGYWRHRKRHRFHSSRFAVDFRIQVDFCSEHFWTPAGLEGKVLAARGMLQKFLASDHANSNKSAFVSETLFEKEKELFKLHMIMSYVSKYYRRWEDWCAVISDLIIVKHIECLRITARAGSGTRKLSQKRRTLSMFTTRGQQLQPEYFKWTSPQFKETIFQITLQMP